jgi:hypothetical protein
MNTKHKDFLFLFVNNILGLYLLAFHSKSIQLYGILLLTIGNLSYLLFMKIRDRE